MTGNLSVSVRESSGCAATADEAEVYRELCKIVDEWIDTLKRDGRWEPDGMCKR